MSTQCRCKWRGRKFRAFLYFSEASRRNKKQEERWPFGCSSSGVRDRIQMDEAVVKLRTSFMKRAVQRVKDMVAHGRREEALSALQEVRRYFEWVREGISPEERGPIFEQIQALPGIIKAR